MGEKQNQPFQLSFNSSLKVDFQGSRVTSDGGLMVVRELDERLGLGDLIAQHLTDSRRGKNTQLPLADLLPVRLQSDSGLRGCERRRAALARSGVPADRFREDLGAWGSPDFATTIVRDANADFRREPGRAGGDQSGVDRQSRSPRFPPACGAGPVWCWT